MHILLGYNPYQVSVLPLHYGMPSHYTTMGVWCQVICLVYIQCNIVKGVEEV